MLNESKIVPTTNKISIKTVVTDEKREILEQPEETNYYCLIISTEEYNKMKTDLDRSQETRRKKREAGVTKSGKHRLNLTPVVIKKIIPISVKGNPISISINKIGVTGKTLDPIKHPINTFIIWPTQMTEV